MKIKGKALCKIAVMLSIIMAVTTALPVNAKLKDEDKVMKISKKEAVEFALKNNVGMKRIDTGLDTLVRKLKETQELSDNVKKFQEKLFLLKSLSEKYMKLLSSPEYQKSQNLEIASKQLKALDSNDPNYEQKRQELLKKVNENNLTDGDKLVLKNLALTNQEQATLKALKAEFESILGPDFTKQQMSKKDEYQMIVMPRDVIWYKVEGKLRQTKLLKEASTKKIEIGINELYNGIVQMSEGYDVKKKLYDKQSKEYDQMLIRKKVGDASEIERIISYIELQKLKLDLSKMQRQIDNLEIQLKNIMGIGMNQRIELIDKNTDAEEIGDIKDYDTYLNTALSSRSEVNSAKVDVDVSQWEIDKMEDYFESDDIEYEQAKDALEDARTSVDNAMDDVTENIEFAYNDVIQKRHEIELKRQKNDEMKIQYEAAYNGYKQGVKPLSLTWTVELGKAKTEFDLKQAIMNYNNAVKKLEAASGIGPKYEIRGEN